MQTAIVQTPNLVVRQAEAIRTIPVITTTNGPYIRADLLATALGGSAGMAEAGRYRITLGEASIWLFEGIPFVRVNAEMAPLYLPPIRSGNTFLVPYQLATSVIPRFATGFNYDVANRELRIFSTVARRVETPAPAPPDPATSVAPGTATPGLSVPSRPRRTQRRLIVVDAGHGGPDNGMTGPIGAGP